MSITSRTLSLPKSLGIILACLCVTALTATTASAQCGSGVGGLALLSWELAVPGHSVDLPIVSVIVNITNPTGNSTLAASVILWCGSGGSTCSNLGACDEVEGEEYDENLSTNCALPSIPGGGWAEWDFQPMAAASQKIRVTAAPSAGGNLSASDVAPVVTATFVYDNAGEESITTIQLTRKECG